MASVEGLAEEAPRVRGPYRKGVASRARIVNAASEAFAQNGYAGASIRTIAARVGTSPATLFQHFGSKEGLLEAVLDDWNRHSVPEHLEKAHGLDYFDRRLRSVMPFHILHKGLIQLFLTMTSEATNPDHPAHDFIQKRYAQTLADVTQGLREAIADGDIPPMSEELITAEARLMFAVMDGIELQWLLNPEVDLVGLFNHYLDSTLRRWREGAV